MALFDEVKNVEELRENEPFILLGFTSSMVPTQYGDKERFILQIKRSDDSSVEYFSGYSAGIMSQLRNASRSDFPTWAKIETTQGRAGRSGTKVLVPGDKADQLPGTEDDIPF